MTENINNVYDNAAIDEDIKDIIKENNDIIAEKINNLIDINNISYAKKYIMKKMISNL